MVDYLEQVFGPDGVLARRFGRYEARPGQVSLARAVDQAFRERRHLVAEGPTGCHVAGQGILLFDGRVRAVEDIRVGDLLAGPDREPRYVTALARGRQETATVIPVKGKSWRVNLDHVLTLVRTDTDRLVDVTVRQWMSWSKTQKHLHKIFRTGAPFEASALPLDPYFVGVLLGDGSHSTEQVAIHKADQELHDLAREQAALFGLRTRVAKDGDSIFLVGEGSRWCANPITQILRDLKIVGIDAGDLFIPDPYKRGSEATRISVLAGLLDTDGSLSSANSYDWISKSERLAEDLCFVARSLGLAAYAERVTKSCQGGFQGVYHRVSLSGDTARIPCRIPRKKATERLQKKSVLRTGFDVVPSGLVEDYFGFSLSGDGRYLLDDFTVTHNTGKSLAYGVPASFYAAQGAAKVDRNVDPFDTDEGKTADNPERVVICTANIALQEQLVKKDLPLLQEILPWSFTFDLLKGRSNYLCLEKYRDSEIRGRIPSTSDLFKNAKGAGTHHEKLVQITKWKDTTQTGDMSELPFVPDKAHWALVSSTAEDCLGDKCDFEDECFADKARAIARNSDIIVTNFHVLLAHLKIRAETSGYASVLPPFKHLVVDEAHELADVARSFLGFTRGAGSFKQIVTKAREWDRHYVADKIELESDRFFEQLKTFSETQSYKSARRLRPGALDGWVDPVTLIDALRSFAAVADDRHEDEMLPKRERVTAAKFYSKAVNAAADIERAILAEDDSIVFYLESEARGSAVKLCGQMIDVAPMLVRELFARTPVVLTSATMTTNNNFEFLRSELGLVPLSPELEQAPAEDDGADTIWPKPIDTNDVIELIAETPFNYEEQALLVIPEMPDPRSDEFVDAAAAVFAEVIDYFDGRTLGLFTSYKTLNAVTEKIRASGREVLVQGEKPRVELARIFREDPKSVLLGVSSFWTGLDVPGDSLSAVVIDKIPFPNADDPVIWALCSRVKDSFHNVMIPKGTIKLRQGVGRLVRSKTDTGVVVILDRRLLEKRYGKIFKRSLPPMRWTRDTNNIHSFMAEAKQWVAENVPQAAPLPAPDPAPDPEALAAADPLFNHTNPIYRDWAERPLTDDEIPF